MNRFFVRGAFKHDIFLTQFIVFRTHSWCRSWSFSYFYGCVREIWCCTILFNLGDTTKSIDIEYLSSRIGKQFCWASMGNSFSSRGMISKRVAGRLQILEEYSLLSQLNPTEVGQCNTCYWELMAFVIVNCSYPQVMTSDRQSLFSTENFSRQLSSILDEASIKIWFSIFESKS